MTARAAAAVPFAKAADLLADLAGIGCRSVSNDTEADGAAAAARFELSWPPSRAGR